MQALSANDRLVSRTILFAAALLLAAPTVLAGQESPTRVTVTGQVLDRQTREPIRGALVEVPGRGRPVGTDAEGRFRMDVREGEHLVSVSRLGYAELRSQLTLSANTGTVTFLMDALESITVVYDRIERRRQRVTTTSHVLDRSALLNRSGSLADVVARSRYFVRGTGCGIEYCAATAGRAVPPAVFIDDIRAFGGMSELASYSPTEIERVEVYGRGAQVRAYTERYVERVASGRARLRPFIRW
jgi:hypothetical protein